MAKSLKIVGLAVLVVVDLIAIVLALQHVNKTPDESKSSFAVPSATPSTAASTTAAKTSSSATPTGLATGGDIIATYVSGSCDSSGAQIDISSDRGKSFQEVALPLMSKADVAGNQGVEVTSILGVTVISAKELSIIGTDGECTAHQYATKDGGQDWSRAASISQWYIDQNKVGTPTGVVDPECDALSISPISDRNAKVACMNGQIRGTDDVGQTWVGLASLDGMTAASFSSLLSGTGTAKTADCGSRAYSTISGGGTWTPLGCIDKTKTATAIGGSASLLAALVDGDVYVSTDRGTTWSNPA